MTIRTGRLFIVASCAAMAALLFSAGFNLAQSQDNTKRGPFMIAAGSDRMVVWRVDQATGAISYCIRDIVSMDRKFIASRPPFCSAWSE